MKLSNHPTPIGDDGLEALICDCLDLLLPTLPLEQANVIRAVDVEGALPQSVAKIDGLSLNRVTTLLVHGRHGLKGRFGEMLVIRLQHGLAGCACRLTDDAET